MCMSEPKSLTLTVFTPAFNRAALLPRLFDSIAAQSPHGSSVEWLVIDDGSSDDTPRALEDLKQRRPDLVRCTRVENGGKHRAINRAAGLARGRWLMIVDSDDMLAEGALTSVMAHIAAVESDERIGMLRGLREFPELSVSHRFQVPLNPCKHTQWLALQPAFDTAEVIRTCVLSQYPFPDFEGERFMAEGWLWHSLEKTHLTQYVDSHWVVCFYQAEGLSANSQRVRARAPRSARAVYAAMLASPLPWRLRIRAGINWWRYHFHAATQGHPPDGASFPSRWLALPGWLLFRRDCRLPA
jgi:glycosyltransferase involved in cell wall biosynthesis